MSDVASPGCVVLLIDESAAMDSPVQDAVGAGGTGTPGQVPKSKSASVATATNALLKRLGNGSDFDIAVVGYHTDGDQAVVESRWAGALAGRDFVSVREMADMPATIEERTRKVPNPAGFGPPIEQPVQFPVWYTPDPKGQACQVAAFRRCRDLIGEWSATAGTSPGVPLVIHLFAGGSGDGNPHQVVQEILSADVGGANPLVLQAHLSTSSAVPPTPYPSNRYYLPAGPQKDLFARCSPLPPHLAAALKSSSVMVNENAVGMLYNARMLDIVTLLKLIDAHTKDWPARAVAVTETVETPATPVGGDEASVTPPVPSHQETAATDSEVATGGSADTPSGDAEGASLVPVVDPEVAAVVPGEELPEATIDKVPEEPVVDPPIIEQEFERAALFVVVLDRSLSDPFDAGTGNACSRLQENANGLLGRLALKPTDAIDLALVSYGTDVAGDVEIRTGFEGSLGGQSFVRDTALLEGALRVDEFTKKVPDGIGGLMERPVKQPIFLELEPAAAASPVGAFEAVGQVLTEWCGQHPASKVPPIVLHLTRGDLEPGDVEQSVASLGVVDPAAGPVLHYPLIVTEDAHSAVVLSDQLADDESDSVQALFAQASPLLDRERLAVEKPAVVQAESRGFVINGKIDLVLDTVLEMLTPSE